MRTSPSYITLLVAALPLGGCLIFNDPMPPRSAALHEISADEQEYMCARICDDIEPFSLTCRQEGDEDGSTQRSIAVSPEVHDQCDEKCSETASVIAGMSCEMTVGEYMDLMSRTGDCDVLDHRAEVLLSCVFMDYP